MTVAKITVGLFIEKIYKQEFNNVAQPTETSCETNETMKEIIEMLRKELEAKESIKAAQLLQANSEQKLKMIEKPAEEAERQGRKHWWQRWRD